MKPEIEMIKKTRPPFLQWTEYKFVAPFISQDEYYDFKSKMFENSGYKINRISIVICLSFYMKKLLFITGLGLILGIIGAVIDFTNNNLQSTFESIIGGVFFIFFFKLIRGGLKSIISFLTVVTMYNLHFKTLELRIKNTENYEVFLSHNKKR